MKAKLVERGASPEETREIPLNDAEFLIGRGADCNLRLRVSSISRHHCLIRLGNDEATLVDLGSSNGTYLNGDRVRSQATLHNGDEIQIGVCRFEVKLGDDQAGLDTALGVDPFTATAKLPPEALARKKPRPSRGAGQESPGGGPSPGR
jgi:pSer/pThr/pTyr-binding forkhead associated (FHA) protein